MKIPKKIISLKKLLLFRNRSRIQRKKVVFTNGCFDLIHVGHVLLLEKARELGNTLIVGLNSDHSVRRLKGPPRPLTPLWARAKVLSSLSCVDYVIPFKEDTPLRLIRTLRPDILVKGADYKSKHIVGREFAGKVVRIPLRNGFSTTHLIQKLRKNRPRVIFI
ncbi:MAG: D-glycero-beta-D-manno-heptose 1-phosphate adenylyltransferase [Elusimicrobia bacterium]|nr:D-glycero-beta-D-manno-heptose 1-phosphate adenylyltransferase [Elusimicrobiota bacterium]